MDGFPGGWLVASSPTDLSRLVFSIEPSIQAVFTSAEANRAIVAIDIPIGLPSSGPR